MRPAPRPLRRCEWAESSRLLRAYHDREWGVPLHNNRKLFEFLILDGFQAGLSWELILRKRAALRRVFANFDARKVAGYTPRDVRRLLADSEIIRNRFRTLTELPAKTPLAEAMSRDLSIAHRDVTMALGLLTKN